MLLKESLAGIEDVSKEHVEMYVARADIHLSDTLESKKELDARGLLLLRGYITLVFAVLGLGVTYPTLLTYAVISAVILCAGIACLLACAYARLYASCGSDAAQWLDDERHLTVDPTWSHLPSLYVLHQLAANIRMNNSSNDKKSRWLNIGIICGALSVIPCITYGIQVIL